MGCARSGRMIGVLWTGGAAFTGDGLVMKGPLRRNCIVHKIRSSSSETLHVGNLVRCLPVGGSATIVKLSLSPRVGVRTSLESRSSIISLLRY